LNVLADNNEVGLASIGDIAGVSIDRNSLCYVFITYPRLFNFENQRSFFFSIDNIQNRYLEINNFNGGTAPVLYDLTNNVRLVPTLDGTTYKIFLPSNGGTLSKRDLYISNTTETTTDAKGKQRKRYPYRLMMTPYEKFKSLPQAETFLKLGVDFKQLNAQAKAMSDNDAAEQMNAARSVLFKSIFNRSKTAA